MADRGVYRECTQQKRLLRYTTTYWFVAGPGPPSAPSSGVDSPEAWPSAPSSGAPEPWLERLVECSQKGASAGMRAGLGRRARDPVVVGQRDRSSGGASEQRSSERFSSDLDLCLAHPAAPHPNVSHSAHPPAPTWLQQLRRKRWRLGHCDALQQQHTGQEELNSWALVTAA